MTHTVRAAGPWEYFCRKVAIGHPDDCWEWMGSLGGPGYGNWGYRKQGTAHRAAFKLFNGEPDGFVLHKCGNRKCCNPDHLYDGDQRQNKADSVRHGTASKPPDFYGKEVKNQYGHSPLDEDKVREIRQRRENGERNCDLAKEYKVSTGTISAIFKRKNWGWVV